MTNKRRLPTIGAVNATDAAKLTGISTRQFQTLINSDKPPPKSTDSTYDLKLLGEWLKERHLGSVKTSDGAVLLNGQQELARKNKELADKTALENRLRRGELIEMMEVESGWQTILSRVRSRILGIASSAAPLVMGLDDQITIQETIDDFTRDALSELSANWRENDE